MTAAQRQELMKALPHSLLTATNWWYALYAREKQVIPPGDWTTWLLLAGRGFGKTRTITEFGHECARTQPGSIGAVVGATAGDVRDVLVEGESGLLAVAPPHFRPRYEPSKSRLSWPNGTIAVLRSADAPHRLRGLQSHWAIADELAVWRYPEAWDMLMMGLRLGDNPRVAVGTTPRPVPHIRELLADAATHVTTGSTYENRANLAAPFFRRVIKKYEGTRLGRQELLAELLDDMPGALWAREMLDRNRVSSHPPLRRVVVAVDPPATDNPETSEAGIIVCGLGENGEGYILDDASLHGSPDTWATAAIAAYHKFGADRIVVETNNGGDMVGHTLWTVDKNVAVEKVRAMKGKYIRAEPVAALFEQNRCHPVGFFAGLEDQLCSWVPGMKSPDRLDALVWAFTELMVKEEQKQAGTW